MATWTALNEIAKGGLAATALFFALCIVWVGIKIARGNVSEYKSNMSRAKSVLEVFFGRVVARGPNDDKVAAGLALKKGKWIEQGRYSEEALHDALER